MDTVDGQPHRDRLRAADTDRERVAELLRSAHAEGRLDLAEYDDRVQQAWAARTYGELDSLTADLPYGQGRSAPQTAPPAGRYPGHLSHRDDPGRHDPSRDDPGRHDPSRQDRWMHRRGRARRGSVAAWLSASVINLVIWAIVSLSTLSWIYPWWIWVAGPWGAVLLVGWLTDRGGDAESSR